MKILLQYSVLVLIGIYLLSGALLTTFQRSLLYFPSSEYQHELEVLVLEHQQQTLNILVLNPGMSKALVYFGGNAEPVIFNEKPFSENFSQYTIYLVNYRGYGGSSGKPTEKNLYSDALAIYDEIQNQYETVSLMGRSLGSGVATYLASKRSVEALVLITPYDSIKNVAQRHFPLYPMSLLLIDKYDSVERAPDISADTLIVMAELDQIIPNEHSIKLAQAFTNNELSIVQIDGADHNNLSVRLEFYTAIKDFLQRES